MNQKISRAIGIILLTLVSFNIVFAGGDYIGSAKVTVTVTDELTSLQDVNVSVDRANECHPFPCPYGTVPVSGLTDSNGKVTLSSYIVRADMQTYWDLIIYTSMPGYVRDEIIIIGDQSSPQLECIYKIFAQEVTLPDQSMQIEKNLKLRSTEDGTVYLREPGTTNNIGSSVSVSSNTDYYIGVDQTTYSSIDVFYDSPAGTLIGDSIFRSVPISETQQTEVIFNPVTATQLEITASPGFNVQVDGFIELTAKATDSSNNPVWNLPIQFDLSSAHGSFSDTSTVTQETVNTDENGEAVITFYAGTLSTQLDVTASVLTLSDQKTITISAGGSDQLAITSPNPAVTTAGLTPVTVQALDQYGNLRTQDNTNTVYLTSANGRSFYDDEYKTEIINQANPLTLQNGQAVIWYENTLAETDTLTAYGTNHQASTPYDITISPAQAHQIIITNASPINVNAGQTFWIGLEGQDEYGNTRTMDSSITIDLMREGTLINSGTMQNGFANIPYFSTLSGTYSINAYCDPQTCGYSVFPSKTIIVSHGSAYNLSLEDNPSEMIVGRIPITIRAQDQYCNIRTSDSANTVYLTSANGRSFYDQETSSTLVDVLNPVTLSNGLAEIWYENHVPEVDTLTAYSSAYSNSEDLIITITCGSADHLEILPVTATAGRTPITITARDMYGNLRTQDSINWVFLTSFNGKDFYRSDISSTIIDENNPIQFLDGQAVIWYENTKAETDTLTAESIAGIYSSDSVFITISPASPYQLVIANTPLSTTAGIRKQLLIQSHDQYNNIITDSATQAYLTADNGGSFYTQQTGGSIINQANQLTLQNGEAVAWYENTQAGTDTVSVVCDSCSYTHNPDFDITIIPAGADHLSIINTPLTIPLTDREYTLMQIRGYDQYGNIKTDDSTTQLTLSTDGSGYFTTTLGGVQTNAEILNQGALNVYYYDTESMDPDPEITISSVFYGSIQDQISITNASPDHITITNPQPITMTAGESVLLNLERRDEYENVLESDSAVLNLATTSSGNFKTSIGGPNVSSVTLSSGTASIYYNDTTADPNPILTITCASSTMQVQTEIIINNASPAILTITNPSSSPSTITVEQTQQVIAMLTDAYNNPIIGEAVFLTITSGPGMLAEPGITETDITGSVFMTFYPSTVSGASTSIRADYDLLEDFTTINTAPGALSRIMLSPTETIVCAGTNLSLTAQLTDQYFNPINQAGENIHFELTAGNAVINPEDEITTAGGQALTMIALPDYSQDLTITAQSLGLTSYSSTIHSRNTLILSLLDQFSQPLTQNGSLILYDANDDSVLKTFNSSPYESEYYLNHDPGAGLDVYIGYEGKGIPDYTSINSSVFNINLTTTAHKELIALLKTLNLITNVNDETGNPVEELTITSENGSCTAISTGSNCTYLANKVQGLMEINFAKPGYINSTTQINKNDFYLLDDTSGFITITNSAVINHTLQVSIHDSENASPVSKGTISIWNLTLLDSQQADGTNYFAVDPDLHITITYSSADYGMESAFTTLSKTQSTHINLSAGKLIWLNYHVNDEKNDPVNSISVNNTNCSVTNNLVECVFNKKFTDEYINLMNSKPGYINTLLIVNENSDFPQPSFTNNTELIMNHTLHLLITDDCGSSVNQGIIKINELGINIVNGVALAPLTSEENLQDLPINFLTSNTSYYNNQSMNLPAGTINDFSTTFTDFIIGRNFTLSLSATDELENPLEDINYEASNNAGTCNDNTCYINSYLLGSDAVSINGSKDKYVTNHTLVYKENFTENSLDLNLILNHTLMFEFINYDTSSPVNEGTITVYSLPSYLTQGEVSITNGKTYHALSPDEYQNVYAVFNTLNPLLNSRGYVLSQSLSNQTQLRETFYVGRRMHAYYEVFDELGDPLTDYMISSDNGSCQETDCYFDSYICDGEYNATISKSGYINTTVSLSNTDFNITQENTSPVFLNHTLVVSVFDEDNNPLNIGTLIAWKDSSPIHLHLLEGSSIAYIPIHPNPDKKINIRYEDNTYQYAVKEKTLSENTVNDSLTTFLTMIIGVNQSLRINPINEFGNEIFHTIIDCGNGSYLSVKNNTSTTCYYDNSTLTGNVELKVSSPGYVKNITVLPSDFIRDNDELNITLNHSLRIHFTDHETSLGMKGNNFTLKSDIRFYLNDVYPAGNLWLNFTEYDYNNYAYVFDVLSKNGSFIESININEQNPVYERNKTKIEITDFGNQTLPLSVLMNSTLNIDNHSEYEYFTYYSISPAYAFYNLNNNTYLPRIQDQYFSPEDLNKGSQIQKEWVVGRNLTYVLSSVDELGSPLTQIMGIANSSHTLFCEVNTCYYDSFLLGSNDSRLDLTKTGYITNSTIVRLTDFINQFCASTLTLNHTLKVSVIDDNASPVTHGNINIYRDHELLNQTQISSAHTYFAIDAGRNDIDLMVNYTSNQGLLEVNTFIPAGSLGTVQHFMTIQTGENLTLTVYAHNERNEQINSISLNSDQAVRCSGQTCYFNASDINNVELNLQAPGYLDKSLITTKAYLQGHQSLNTTMQSSLKINALTSDLTNAQGRIIINTHNIELTNGEAYLPVRQEENDDDINITFQGYDEFAGETFTRLLPAGTINTAYQTVVDLDIVYKKRFYLLLSNEDGVYVNDTIIEGAFCNNNYCYINPRTQENLTLKISKEGYITRTENYNASLIGNEISTNIESNLKVLFTPPDSLVRVYTSSNSLFETLSSKTGVQYLRIPHGNYYLTIEHDGYYSQKTGTLSINNITQTRININLKEISRGGGGNYINTGGGTASDLTPPTIHAVVINNTTPYPNETINIKVTATDNTGIARVLANGIELTHAFSNVWEGNITAEESSILYIRVLDHAGNVATNTQLNYTVIPRPDEDEETEETEITKINIDIERELINELKDLGYNFTNELEYNITLLMILLEQHDQAVMLNNAQKAGELAVRINDLSTYLKDSIPEVYKNITFLNTTTYSADSQMILNILEGYNTEIKNVSIQKEVRNYKLGSQEISRIFINIGDVDNNDLFIIEKVPPNTIIRATNGRIIDKDQERIIIWNAEQTDHFVYEVEGHLLAQSSQEQKTFAVTAITKPLVRHITNMISFVDHDDEKFSMIGLIILSVMVFGLFYIKKRGII